MILNTSNDCINKNPLLSGEIEADASHNQTIQKRDETLPLGEPGHRHLAHSLWRGWVVHSYELSIILNL